MTAARSTLRPRRRNSAENLPRTLVNWFSGVPRKPGESSVPWAALVYPDYVLLPERWLIWKKAHPDAQPPAGYEWLGEADASTRYPDWLLTTARKCAARVRCLGD